MRSCAGWSAPTLRRSCSQAAISASSSSTKRRLVASVVAQGFGISNVASRLATVHAEEIGDRHRMPDGDEDGVDPVLQGGPLAD